MFCTWFAIFARTLEQIDAVISDYIRIDSLKRLQLVVIITMLNNLFKRNRTSKELRDEGIMKTRIFMSVIVFVYILFLSTAAQGAVIPLSTHSSDELNVPASWLDATMDLSVDNVGYWELTLAVTNMTPETVDDTAFKMSELYFNTSAPITSLTLDSVVGGSKDDWTLTLNMDSILVGGFGLFDISLISNQQNLEWIDPKETVTFKIMIDAGTPPYTDTDFFALSSMDSHPEHILAYGVAKFFGGGPEGLSARGAYVPEPATIFMLGFGALALLRKRRP